MYTTTIILSITFIIAVSSQICDEPGLCLGQIIYSETSEDKVACLSFCKSTDECAWFSFDTTGILSTCILFMDCPEIEENPQYVSGQKECDLSNGGQYLIAGGRVDVYPASDETTEVVQLVKTNSTPSFGQLPSEQIGALGTMLGNAPILCGGEDEDYNSLDTCISYRQDSKWIQSNTMVKKRNSAAGVKVNTTTFWILGGHGYDSWKPWDSTEFIIQGQTNGVSGPKLPYGMDGMCAVKISENEIFVIGGYADFEYRNEVWIYDPQNGFARTQGPSFPTPRIAHSCSTMKDGKKTLIVVAGGYNNGDLLDSVEIYDPTDNTWHSGPFLPYGLRYSAMAESPDGRGVILFGGFAKRGYEKRILELRAGADSWNILDVSLENARSYHVVFPLT